MVTYISLVNWTEQGIKGVKESVQRAEASAAAIERAGGRILSIYWTQGSRDLIVTTEFPDEQSAQAFALAMGSQGNFRTETRRAFTAAEMTEIIQRLP